MPYLEMVLKETMRLLPTVAMIARSVPEDTELCGKHLPAGTTLVVNIIGVHRDPRHWPDPLTFDPERFLPERSEGRQPFCFVPFAAGPRYCFGREYAMMQMKLLLAATLREFDLLPAQDGISHPSQMRLTMGLTTQQVGGSWVKFQRRSRTATES